MTLSLHKPIILSLILSLSGYCPAWGTEGVLFLKESPLPFTLKKGRVSIYILEYLGGEVVPLQKGLFWVRFPSYPPRIIDTSEIALDLLKEWKIPSQSDPIEKKIIFTPSFHSLVLDVSPLQEKEPRLEIKGSIQSYNILQQGNVLIVTFYGASSPSSVLTLPHYWKIEKKEKGGKSIKHLFPFLLPNQGVLTEQRKIKLH